MEASRRTARRIPLPLALILAAAAVQVVAWALATAPLQGPDEPDHFGYVQHLAETGSPPKPLPDGGARASTEAGAALEWLGLGPMTGNVAGRPAWTDADLQAWRRIDRSIGDSGRSNGAGMVARNPPLYYAYEAIPYLVFEHANLLDRVLAMRLWSALLYLVTIVLTWLVAGELLGRGFARTLATAVVAAMPELAFMGGLINPDTMLIALSTGFLYVAIRLVKRGPSAPRVLGLGALTAAAILTHGRGFALVPPALVALGLAYWRHGVRDRRRLALAVGGLAVLASGPLIAALVTTSGGGSAYGGEVGAATGGGFNANQFASYVWQFYLPKLGFMTQMIGPPYGFRQLYIERLFGTFGSLEIMFPSWVYDWLHAAALAGLAAFVAACVAARRRLRAGWPLVALLLVVLLSLVALLHYIAYRHLQGTPGDPLLTGRYLLPVVALFGVAVAFVVQKLPRPAGAAVGALLVTTGVVLQLSGLGLSLARFYA